MKKISCNNNVQPEKRRGKFGNLKSQILNNKVVSNSYLDNARKCIWMSFEIYLKLKKKVVILPLSWNSATEDKSRAKPSTTSNIFLAYHQTIQFIHMDIHIEQILEQLKPREGKSAVRVSYACPSLLFDKMTRVFNL